MNIKITYKEFRQKYDTIAREIKDKELYQKIQHWMDLENAKQGYLLGLAPQCNITQISQLIKECDACTNHNGQHCSLNHLLRNKAAISTILLLLEEDLIEEKDKAISLIYEKYESFIWLREYAQRKCPGHWYRFNKS